MPVHIYIHTVGALISPPVGGEGAVYTDVYFSVGAYLVLYPALGHFCKSANFVWPLRRIGDRYTAMSFLSADIQ